MDDKLVSLGLENISDGELNRAFKELIPTITEEIFATEKKASISIVIEFERVADTNRMVSTKFKIGHKLPTRERSGMAYMADGFNLKAEVNMPRLEKGELFDSKTGEILRREAK